MRKRARGLNSTLKKKANWKERWFELDSHEIRYYDKFRGSTEGGNKKGAVELKDVIDCFSGEPNEYQGKDNVFVIKYADMKSDLKEVSLCIQAADETERESWLNAVRETCGGKLASGSSKKASSNGVSNESTPRPSYVTCDTVVDTPTPTQEKKPMAVPGYNQNAKLPPTPTQTPTPKVKYMVIAVHNYKPTSPDDLKLTKGDLLDVLDDSEPNWWKAANSDGDIGYIPSNYVKKKRGLEHQEWFLGKMGRQEAMVILKGANASGTFLVRESESQKGEYSLSVIHEDFVKHYRIRSQIVPGGEKEVFINDRHRFEDIEKMIEYHRLNAGGLIARLRNTVEEAKAPPTAGFGRGKFEIPKSDIELGRKLGEGNFGIVYLGKYKHHTPVAVKTLKNENRVMEEDFVAEARVMLNLTHQHLVQVMGVCLDAPMFIVQEFLAGGCLLDYLRDESISLCSDDLHMMCIHVAMGMSYLESKQYIHRDLAARNCLVGNNNIVKVGDFGLARFVLDDEYTASEGTKFPVKWAAPEVIDYNRFSTKSDVWSFGIIMWEIWSRGKKPYPGMDNKSVMQAVSDGHRLGRPDLATAQMHEVMMRTWHKDRQARPSFQELIRLLNDVGEYADDSDFR